MAAIEELFLAMLITFLAISIREESDLNNQCPRTSGSLKNRIQIRVKVLQRLFGLIIDTKKKKTLEISMLLNMAVQNSNSDVIV